MRPTLLLVIALIALAPALALAQGTKLAPDAQAHLDAALVAYNAKDWPTAIREFDLAYAIDPKPALLYATAQAHRFAGNCPVALTLYKKYLESAPNETQIEAARVGIATCNEPTPKPKPQPVTPPPIVDPVKPAQTVAAAAPTSTEPPVQDTAPREGGPRPWYKDPLAGALTVSGVVGIGVGVSFLVMASSSKSRSETAEFRDDFTAALDEAESRNRIGGVALAAGSALVITGVVVYVLRAKGTSSTIAGGTDGRSVYVAGRF